MTGPAAPPPDLVLRPNRLWGAVYLLTCLGFAAIGGFMIAEGQGAGWFVAGFFGLGVAVFSIGLLPGASYLRLSAEGFTLCSLYRRRDFAWGDVGPFFPGVISGRKMVLFDFADSAYRPRWRAVARALSGAEDALPDTYGMTAGELAALMNDWRENVYAADETTGPLALSSTEISERLPVWHAISELWLDSELTEADLTYLAGRLADSRYSLSELEDIYLVEVAPVVHDNLRQVAGDWGLFDLEWLKEAVLRHLADPHHRARALRQKAYMTEFVAEDWNTIMAASESCVKNRGPLHLFRA